MNNLSFSIIASSLLLVPISTWAEQAKDTEIEKIEVTAELLPTTIQQAATSVDIVNQSLIEQLGANHIQDVLLQVGNVNYSSGSSRARFFQVRGIGERSQFVDPVNPSVGIAIDGIDYSGMAGAATLFDIGQVEIYKGPQGSNLGANAMAGFINLASTPAGSSESAKFRVEKGNYGLTQIAGAYGGNIDDDTRYRVSMSKLTGDGYIHNTYLDRHDTNGFDELSARLALDVNINDAWLVKSAFHYFDIDNGYDAFSLEHDRTTLSDQPGFDKQNTTALALTNYYTGFNSVDMKVFVSQSNSDLDYGYDEDWAYQGISPIEYSSIDHYLRDRDTTQFDISFAGKDKSWVVGIYNQDKDVGLSREYTWLAENFTSQFQVMNTAIYGEKRFNLSESVKVSAGARIEHYQGDYLDSNGVDTSSEDTMWGGHISAQKHYDNEFMSYIRWARGFKAGSVNGEALSRLNEEGLERFYFELRDNASFAPEVLTNIELGLRYHTQDRRLSANASLFYADRDNMQIKQWLTNELEVTEGQPPIFVGYISNAPSGSNYGLETSARYQWLDALNLYASYALLETEVDNMQRLAVDPETGFNKRVDINGREQAHAPDYQYTFGADWQVKDRITLNVNMSGKGGYFYSYSHDKTADAVELVNASLTYQGDSLDVTVWGRNLTDREYGVRGFYFGNDPRDGYAAKTYEQFGEPFVFGVKLDYVF